MIRRALLGAAVLVVGAGRAAAQGPTEPPRSWTEAQRLHEEGVQLYRAGEFEPARAAFEAAERLAPNPTNVYNIARCEQRLGRTNDALGSAVRYLDAGDLSADERAAGTRLLEELRRTARLAHVAPVQLVPPVPIAEPHHRSAERPPRAVAGVEQRVAGAPPQNPAMSLGAALLGPLGGPQILGTGPGLTAALRIGLGEKYAWGIGASVTLAPPNGDDWFLDGAVEIEYLPRTAPGDTVLVGLRAGIGESVLGIERPAAGVAAPGIAIDPGTYPSTFVRLGVVVGARLSERWSLRAMPLGIDAFVTPTTPEALDPRPVLRYRTEFALLWEP